MKRKKTLISTKLRKYALLEAEQADAVRLLQLLTDALGTGARIVDASGANEANIPAGVLAAITDLVGVLATKPEAVTIVVDDSEMTTSREAAWLLGLAAGEIYKLQQAKVIPGSQLQIRMADLIAYQAGRTDTLPYRGHIATPTGN